VIDMGIRPIRSLRFPNDSGLVGTAVVGSSYAGDRRDGDNFKNYHIDDTGLLIYYNFEEDLGSKFPNVTGYTQGSGSGYTYIMTITISNPNDYDLTDYQIKIDLSPYLPYTTHIKITEDAEGNQVLPFVYVNDDESISDTPTTKVWVKIPNIPANGETVIYVFEADTNYATTGDNVFDFFDDFEGTDLDTNKWTLVNDLGATVSISNSKLSMYYEGSAHASTYIYSNQSFDFSKSFVIEYYGTFYHTSGYKGIKVGMISDTTDITDNFEVLDDWDNIADGVSYRYAVKTKIEGTLYTGNFIDKTDSNFEPITGKFTIIHNPGNFLKGILPTNEVSQTDTTFTSGTPRVIFRIQSWGDYGDNKLDVKLDWIRVRKYADQEPTYTINIETVGFKYRMPITIQENSGNTLTDFQVRIEVDTETLINQGKMNSDCSDIRFVQEVNGEKYFLPYWIESGAGTSSTVIWVKVKEIPANGTATIYMYYGNENATSKSNGEVVFEFFDDFEDGTLDTTKWNVLAGTVTEENSMLSIQYDGNGRAKVLANYNLPVSEIVEVRVSYTTLDTSSSDWFGLSFSLNSDGSVNTGHAEWGILAYWRQNGNVEYVDGTNSGLLFTETHSSEDFFSAGMIDTTVLYVATQNNKKDATTVTLGTSNYFQLSCYYTSVNIDWVCVRKYASSEPTTSLGTEEDNPDYIEPLITFDAIITGSYNNTDTDGISGKYIELTGGTLEIENFDKLTFSNGITLSFYLNTTNSDETIITTGNNNFSVSLNTGNVSISFTDSTSTTYNLTSSTQVNDGNWHRITIVINPNNYVRLYVDRQQEDEVSISGDHTSIQGTTFSITSGTGTKIDEFKIYDYVKSWAYITMQRNYEAGRVWQVISGGYELQEGKMILKGKVLYRGWAYHNSLDVNDIFKANDVRIEVRTTTDISIMFKYLDSDNYYKVEVSGGNVYLKVVSGGSETELGSSTISSIQGVLIFSEGDWIEVFVDESGTYKRIISVNDSSINQEGNIVLEGNGSEITKVVLSKISN